MIAKMGDAILDLPAASVGSLAVVLPNVNTIRVSNTLRRVPRNHFKQIVSSRPDHRATPQIWTDTENGQIVVWPAPDQDYPVTARDMGGRDMTGGAKPVELMPVVPLVSAFTSAENQARDTRQPPRAERFDRRPMEDAEE